VSVFFDTNILVYRTGVDEKAIRAETLLREGGIVSVQVLNEFVDVVRRKQRFSWAEVAIALEAFADLVDIVPLLPDAQRLGVRIAARGGFRIYDACILASAALAGCAALYSEDMNHGQVIEGVRIINPFL
jgi:predicted nucleic acid-binding protein